jgi:serine/threonine protein kinase/tetratricopeptide (TPR) repeat protein
MAMPKLDEASIFNAARRIDDPAARRLYVREACGEDGALADRVEALLRMHDEDPTFLASPTEDVRALLGAPTAEGPGTQVGPYRLLRPLGEGGMGTVFLAEQTEPLQRQVAVKVVRPGMDSRQVLARFEQERQALALMDHPNIAKVLDAGATPVGGPYFVMELIDGVPITAYCDGARLSVRRRLELFVPVCQAVQHAHQKGLIHRDLKPGNVLVTLYDGKPVPRVIDFGIAKATGQKLTERTLETQFGTVVGTVDYMSPEQAEPGQPDVDTRSDIYSLGVLLYELLTGTTPLQPARQGGAGLLDLLRAVRESEPPRPSTRLSTTDELPTVAASRDAEPRRLVGLVRGDLDWIVMKCLEKDRARRYETADALARDIERYLNVEPVEASPPSRGYRLRKFARKNRQLLLGAGAFVLLLTAATAVSVWLAVRATAAEGRAVAALDGEAEQRRKAEKSAAESEAVLNFFRDRVLAAARPKGEQGGPKDVEGGLGNDATIRQALEHAEPQIAKEFAGQPLVEANIRHTLANSYFNWGDLNSAVRQQERALELYRQELGPEHPYTIGAMNNLGGQLFMQGEHERALALFKEVVKLQQRVLGLEDRRTLVSMSNLANALWYMKQFPEARKLYDETLSWQRRVQGPDSIDTLRTMNNLAAMLEDQGHLEEARKLYEETLNTLEGTRDREHPLTLTIKKNLADVLSRQGQRKQARKLYEEVLDTRQHVLGPKHIATLETMYDLAKLSAEEGQFEESRRLYEEALKLQRSALRPGHPATLRTMGSLAWMLATASDVKVRDPKRALELAKELVEATPKEGGRWNTLGVAYYRAGDWKGAIAALEKAEELARGKSLGYNAVFLAMAHWQLGEKDKARQWYDRAVGWMEENKSNDPELLQFRAEAAQLLGLPPPDPPGKKDEK